MKTVFYFIITCFISTGALLGATTMHNPFPAFGIVFGVWALFIWGYNKRSRKASERHFKEHMFEQHMRNFRNNRL